MDWKELLNELSGLLAKRAAAETDEERREAGREAERVSDELRRVWQMTDEQIGNALRERMSGGEP